MSAIASFYLVDTSKFDELRQNAEIIVKKNLFSKKVIDTYWDYLANNATELKGFDGSGDLFQPQYEEPPQFVGPHWRNSLRLLKRHIDRHAIL